MAKMVRKSRPRKSVKQAMMGRIRLLKAAGTTLRLNGKIEGAMRYEEDADRLMSQAESKGWADEAMDASMHGVHDGVHNHKKY